MATKIQTLLIGLGQIGALYDLRGAAQDKPLTHLKAITNDSAFEVVGLIDPNVKNHFDIQQASNHSKDIFLRT